METPANVFVSPLAMTVGFSIFSAAADGAMTGATARVSPQSAQLNFPSGWRGTIILSRRHPATRKGQQSNEAQSFSSASLLLRHYFLRAST
jgi:hypothetical protein